MSPTNILPLRPRDHEDTGRVAISWLAERHRKGWRKAFEDLLDHWRPEGPYLTPGQKAWITQLRERPLRLYRVTDVRPGEGLTLVDESDAQAEPQAVRERSGSQSARPGMFMGARIMKVGDASRGRAPGTLGRHLPFRQAARDAGARAGAPGAGRCRGLEAPCREHA